jgi:hypothetical protein
MFLRKLRVHKDGKEHGYWSLVETIRAADGPRQRTLCYLGELNGSAHARWQKTVEVFNEQGEAPQLKLFPSEAEASDEPNVARVLVKKVRVERSRRFGDCISGWSYGSSWSSRSSLRSLSTWIAPMYPGPASPRYWRSTGCVLRAVSWPWNSIGIPPQRWTICYTSKQARLTIRGGIAAWIVS